MDIKKRITQKTEAKFRQIQSLKKCILKLPELPLDIKVNIISRLPVKLIMRCKCLSKAFNKLISSPPFLQLYLTNNKSNFIYTLFVNDYKVFERYEFDMRLDLIEFDLKEAMNNDCDEDNRVLTRFPIFSLEDLPGYASQPFDYSLLWGHCNGLVITRKEERDKIYLFVINPIMGQFIRLPEPPVGDQILLAYGIGFCQLTNRYKVLRIITTYSTRNTCYKYYSQIFTIGCDRNWRRLEHYVPYNIIMDYDARKPPMLAFRSALHWPVRSDILQFEPNRAARGTRICAFDMTQEKVSAFPMPPLLDTSWVRLAVLLDKLSVWEGHGHAYNDVTIWAMEDYGIKCFWTKQFVFKLSTLESTCIRFDPFDLIPLTLLPGGVLVVNDRCQVLFYDMNKDKCLRVVSDESEELDLLVPFVPSFVPLRDPFQG